MHRGYVRQWRKEIDSEIWDMPPLYYKVWRYLIAAADYRTHSLQTTCNIIADKISWRENRSLRVPNRKTIRKILLWLHDKNQVLYTTVGTGQHKMVNLTIVNYDTYHDSTTNLDSKDGQVVKKYKEVQHVRTVKTCEFPTWVEDVLRSWEDIAGLPKRVNMLKCKKTIHDLHRLDKVPPETIADVVRYIAKEKAPKFIASPIKLRATTRAGDQQTFDMYAREHQQQTPQVEDAPWRT